MSEKTSADVSIGIIGGGIAGLSAAHELMKFFDDITIYEPENRIGGKAVSQDVKGFLRESGYVVDDRHANLWLGEHGFRLFPHTYLHVTETMAEIEIVPADSNNGTELIAVNQRVSDRLQGSTEGGYACAGIINKVPRPFPSSSTEFFLEMRRTFADSPFGDEADILKLSWHLLKFITSCPERRDSEYDDLSWLEFVELDQGVYTDGFQRLLRTIPRGLNAMKPDICSARSFGNMMLRFAFDFAQDRGLHFEQVLSGPTQESWLEHWETHFKQPAKNGKDPKVKIRTGCRALGFDFDETSGTIKAVYVEHDEHSQGEAEREGSDAKGSSENAAKKRRVEKHEHDYFICAAPLDNAKRLFFPGSTDGVFAPALDQKQFKDALRLFGLGEERFKTRHYANDRSRAYRVIDRLLRLKNHHRDENHNPNAEESETAYSRLEAVISAEKMFRFDPAIRRLSRIRTDATAPMVGLQFYLSEDLPLLNGHLFLPESQWALTAISQAQFWDPSLWEDGFLFGVRHPPRPGRSKSETGLKGVLSVIISDWEKRSERRASVWIDGKLVRLSKPLSRFSPSDDAVTVTQVIREVWFQLKDSINEPGRAPRLAEWMLLGHEIVENDVERRKLKDSDPTAWLDAVLSKSARIDDHVRPKREEGQTAKHDEPIAKVRTPLFVHPRGSYAMRPDAQLRIPNLMLAADYVRTVTDLATMEAANEAARRAVIAILRREAIPGTDRYPKIYPPIEPAWARAAQAVDRELHRAGKGHVLDTPGLLRTVGAGVAGNILDIGRRLLGADGRGAPPPLTAANEFLLRVERFLQTERTPDSLHKLLDQDNGPFAQNTAATSFDEEHW